ncbi:HNH endonuclease family protein [Pseudoxanthomonas mexicana]
MKIDHQDVKVSELVDGYKDSQEQGVFGYGGKLNIRPAYQREFIYKEKQRNAVIETLRNEFPLNTMYWAVSGDGFELMDGQQRTISICQFVNGDYSVDFDGTPKFFHNLTGDKKQKILDYKLSIYVCEGTDSEKLDWFKTINIAGEKLTDQELRNAIFSGPWLTDAKRWFSKSGAPAVQEGRDKLVNGAPLRQDILETALEWISGGKANIENYMGAHQHDADADELWQYWQRVFAWVKQVFPNQDSARARLMKGLPWGALYNTHKDDKLNAQQLETRIVELIDDDEVENKRGIYEYLLTDNEKTLNLRAFDEKTKQKKFAEQKGQCPKCGKGFEFGEMEADHIIPWHEGGKTEYANCQMLCRLDNRTKSGK